MKVVRGGADFPGNLMDGVKYIIRQLRRTRGEIPNPKLHRARKILETARDMVAEVPPGESQELLLTGLKYAIGYLCEAMNDSKSSVLEEIHEYALELHEHFSTLRRRQQKP